MNRSVWFFFIANTIILDESRDVQLEVSGLGGSGEKYFMWFKGTGSYSKFSKTKEIDATQSFLMTYKIQAIQMNQVH